MLEHVYLQNKLFFALDGKVPKRSNTYTNKLRNLEFGRSAKRKRIFQRFL